MIYVPKLKMSQVYMFFNIRCVREDEEDERNRECEEFTCQHGSNNKAAGRRDNIRNHNNS